LSHWYSILTLAQFDIDLYLTCIIFIDILVLW
jgi:hypothetical protein